ncbi:MAG: hypothetical protein K2X38_13120 [Gemmataceae bacterium]|nr:hypothetical protein [Gemmataceae bacterium]
MTNKNLVQQLAMIGLAHFWAARDLPISDDSDELVPWFLDEAPKSRELLEQFLRDEVVNMDGLLQALRWNDGQLNKAIEREERENNPEKN